MKFGIKSIGSDTRRAPFKLTQLVVLSRFVVLGIVAAIRFPQRAADTHG